MRYWNGLSLFTRILTVVVVLSSCATLYWKTRYAPALETARRHEKNLDELEEQIDRARRRVDRLRRERAAGQKWASYARVLDEQSTGRSLRDVLATCGTASGPAVEVEGLSFERIASGEQFRRLKVSFRLEGPYTELMALLHELDRAFPPIEITQTDLSVPEGGQDERGDRVSATLEGIIHEPM